MATYDALGRIMQSLQTTGSGTYPFGYQYNLAGSLISETYPSGARDNDGVRWSGTGQRRERKFGRDSGELCGGGV